MFKPLSSSFLSNDDFDFGKWYTIRKRDFLKFVQKRSDGKCNVICCRAWVTNWEDYKQNLQTKFESFQVEENKTNLECPRLQSWFFTCRNCADFHRHNIKSMWPFDGIFLAKKLNLPNFHVIWLLLPTTRWRDQRTGTRQAVYCI